MKPRFFLTTGLALLAAPLLLAVYALTADAAGAAPVTVTDLYGDIFGARIR